MASGAAVFIPALEICSQANEEFCGALRRDRAGACRGVRRGRVVDHAGENPFGPRRMYSPTEVGPRFGLAVPRWGDD